MKAKKFLALILAFAMILSTMGTVAFAAEDDAPATTAFPGPYEIVHTINGEKTLINGSIYGLYQTLSSMHSLIKSGDASYEEVSCSNPDLVKLKPTDETNQKYHPGNCEIIVDEPFTETVTVTYKVTGKDGNTDSEKIEITCRPIVADNDGKIGATSEDVAAAWDTFSNLNGQQFFIGDFRGVKDIYRIGFDAWDSEGNPVVVSGLAGVYTSSGWKGINGYSATPSKVTTSHVETLFAGGMFNPSSDVLNIGFALTSEIEEDTTVMITVYNNMVFAPNFPRGNSHALASRSFTFIPDPVATVNGVGYTDIQEAIKAAAPNGTVEVLSDVTVDKWIMFAQNLSIGNGNLITLNMDGLTINGNGHTLTVNSIESAGNGNSLFSDAKNLNINDLTIKYADGLAGGISLQSGTISNVTFDGGKYGVLPGTGDVTIEDCTFKTNSQSIYFEGDRDNLVVTGNTFDTADGQYAILLRGDVTFTDNIITTGKVNVVSGSPVVTGNDFGEERFKVYNGATAKIENNEINNLEFSNPAEGAEVSSTFAGNILDDDTKSALAGKGFIPVAQIGNADYYLLQSAIEAAQTGNTVKLVSDVTEKVVIKAPLARALASNDEAIVVDLNGNTLNGYILIQDANKNIEIKNGNIVNEDSGESAIESNGKLTVTNVNIKSARHAINVEGTADAKGELVINGGNYSLIGSGSTQNAIGVEYATATINDGVFTGPNGLASDSGAAVSAKVGSNVTINGGKFSGGKNDTLAKNETATLVVNGGSFDQDVSAFVADGKEVVKLGDDAGYEYPYIVTDKATSTVAVDLVEAKDENDKVIPGLYDIVLASDGEYDINEFVAAQFTFKNDSKTVGGSTMQYNILGIDDKTTAQKTVVDGEERYIIKIKDAEKVENRLKGHNLIIGQISFVGQGTINFSIAKGEVDTTWQNTNLGRYYENTDAIDNAADTLKLEDAKIEGGSVADITRNVAINVTYNHKLQNVWTAPEMKVTLKDAYGEIVGTDDISDGIATFNNVKIGRITVTLEAPGFRKFVYETTLDEDDDATVVLSFWNDVKKEAYKLPIEKGAQAVAHNFVVGDIVMDYTVDKYDLAAVTSYYGMYNIKDNAKYLKYDLNRDGNIDIRDVQYVLHTMGN